MKILFTILTAITLLTSCGYDTEECLQSVKKEFPTADIYIISDDGYEFLVIDENIIYRVRTYNQTNTEVSDVQVYMTAN